jgi:ubiquinone biosynthesis protein COQ4
MSANMSDINTTPALRREWAHGLRSLWRFIRDPGDLNNSFEAMFALAGPLVEKEFNTFARTEVGRKLLAQTPRSDLNAALADQPSLADMPLGSFAHAYLDYMGAQGMGSSDYFLKAAGLDEKARRFGWSEDQLWFVRRMANSHDLFHIVSGYDRSAVGEVGVVAYTAGQIRLLPLRLSLLYFLTLKPSTPLSWARYIRDAYRHGSSTPSLACVDFESLLPLPLAEARRRIGGPTLEEAHDRGLPAPGRRLLKVEAALNTAS